MTRHRIIKASLLVPLALLANYSNSQELRADRNCPEVELPRSFFSAYSCREKEKFKTSAHVQKRGEKWRDSETEFDYRIVTVMTTIDENLLLLGSGFKENNNDIEFLRNVIGIIPANEMVNDKKPIKRTSKHGSWVIGTEEINYWGAAKGNPVNCSTAINRKRLAAISECYYLTEFDEFKKLLDLVDTSNAAQR